MNMFSKDCELRFCRTGELTAMEKRTSGFIWLSLIVRKCRDGAGQWMLKTHRRSELRFSTEVLVELLLAAAQSC